MLELLKTIFTDPQRERRRALWAAEERKGDEWRAASPLCKSLIDEAYKQDVSAKVGRPRPTVVIHPKHAAVPALETAAQDLKLDGLKLMGFPIELSEDGPREGFTFKD